VSADTAFAPTHHVPDGGIASWSSPDPQRGADGRLAGGLPVRLLEENTGWAHVRCTNGWETWVDARLLVAGASGGTSPPVWSPLTVWLGIVGAALAIGGSFLPWYSAGAIHITAWDLRLVTLVTHEPSNVAIDAGPILMVVVLAVLPLLTRRVLPGWAALGLAGVPATIGVLAVILYGDLPEPRPDLGIGVLVTFAGGLVMGAGVALSPRLLPRPLVRVVWVDG
jgi:hypothetical protein